MAKREILKEGHVVLRMKADKVVSFDKKLHELLDDMYETMQDADGVGLAAPQIGVSKQVLIVEIEDELTEIINPIIIKESGFQLGPEGCLSVDPAKNGLVKRPLKLVVKGQDRNGNKIVIRASELKARALCHEIDHLKGILFIDKIEKEKEE